MIKNKMTDKSQESRFELFVFGFCRIEIYLVFVI